MRPLRIGRLRVTAVAERAGPTRPTWLLPESVVNSGELAALQDT